MLRQLTRRELSFGSSQTSTIVCSIAVLQLKVEMPKPEKVYIVGPTESILTRAR